MPDQTPALDDFRRAYEANPKEWWLLDCGHHMNLFDEALDRIDDAREWAAWFAAERDYVIRCRAQELAAIAGRQKQYREKISEFRAYLAEIVDVLGEPEDTRFDVLPEAVSDLRDRIAELEAAQSDPAGYAVVTRNPEGGVHRSATVWDNLDQARAAEGVQAGYADGTGCTAAVYELREVHGA